MMVSSGKSNGQNSDDEDKCRGPDENSNAVHDECQQGALFVKA